MWFPTSYSFATLIRFEIFGMLWNRFARGLGFAVVCLGSGWFRRLLIGKLFNFIRGLWLYVGPGNLKLSLFTFCSLTLLDDDFPVQQFARAVGCEACSVLSYTGISRSIGEGFGGNLWQALRSLPTDRSWTCSAWRFHSSRAPVWLRVCVAQLAVYTVADIDPKVSKSVRANRTSGLKSFVGRA